MMNNHQIGQCPQDVLLGYFHSILRHIYPSENSPHRVKCHKIMMIYPQPIKGQYFMKACPQHHSNTMSHRETSQPPPPPTNVI